MLAAPLEVVTLGPATSAVVLWRASGVLRATVVVKATFSLMPDREASVSSPLPVERADGSYDDSPARSLRSASELAPYLPSAGVMLTGHAHAPAGAPVSALSARLGLFSGAESLLDKTVHVFGDVGPGGGPAAPFQSMPLVYERACGGPGVPANPVGLGGPGARRPNLLDPNNAHRPAGFGPIAPHWPLRRRLFAGIEPHPGEGQLMDLPGDFDFRAFHAAPLDQQIPFLQGDEWILLDNLSPGRARVQTRLPGASGQARWYLVSGAGASRPRELRMFADTLTIDVDRQMASMVWRGHFPIELPETLPRLRIVAGLEVPGVPIEWPTREAIGGGVKVTASAGSLLRTAPDHGMSEPSPALPFREGAGAPVVFVAAQGERDEPEDPRATTGAIVRSRLEKPALPFPAKEERVEVARSPEATAPRARDEVGGRGDGDGEIEDPRSFTGRLVISRPMKPALPFGNQEPVSAAPTGRWEADETTALFTLPGSGGGPVAAPVVEASLQAPPMVAMASPPYAAVEPLPAPPVLEAPLPSYVAGSTLPISPAISMPLDPSSAMTTPLQEPAKMAVPAAFAPPPAPSTAMAASLPSTPRTAPFAVATPAPSGADPALRRQAEAAIAAGGVLDGEDLSGADLSELDFTGLSLQRCKLRGASLRGARLKNAKLAGADLTGADLTGAELSGASMAKARCDRATLTDAVLADADLAGASFAGVSAERAKLTRARGEGAVFRGANLRRAELGRAQFSKGVFTEADLREAQAEQGSFFGARFVGADLSAASFRKASLAGAVLAFAKLEGTDLRGADLDGANLHGAPRHNANVLGATLTHLDETEPTNLDA